MIFGLTASLEQKKGGRLVLLFDMKKLCIFAYFNA